jgi:hypothetical protein
MPGRSEHRADFAQDLPVAIERHRGTSQQFGVGCRVVFSGVWVVRHVR